MLKKMFINVHRVPIAMLKKESGKQQLSMWQIDVLMRMSCENGVPKNELCRKYWWKSWRVLIFAVAKENTNVIMMRQRKRLNVADRLVRCLK